MTARGRRSGATGRACSLVRCVRPHPVLDMRSVAAHDGGRTLSGQARLHALRFGRAPQKDLGPVLKAAAAGVRGDRKFVPRDPGNGRPDGEIIVEFRRELTLDPEIKGHIDCVIIRDNGSGFTEDNYHAFETADTTYKLALGGKGVGRFTWLVAFAEAVIVSRYNAGADRRAFRFTARSGIEDAPEFERSLWPAAGTTVALYGFKSPWRERSPGSLELIAIDIIEHFVALFVGASLPSVVLIDGIERLDLQTEFARTYDAQASRRQFVVGSDSFTVTGLRLRRRQAGRSHRLLYLAHQREAKTETLVAHLPGPSQSTRRRTRRLPLRRFRARRRTGPLCRSRSLVVPDS